MAPFGRSLADLLVVIETYYLQIFICFCLSLQFLTLLFDFRDILAGQTLQYATLFFIKIVALFGGADHKLGITGPYLQGWSCVAPCGCGRTHTKNKIY
jgi:hypothetical protein